jgi:tRNA(Ile)-lysidine synthase
MKRDILSFHQKVDKTIHDNSLFRSGETVVVAVSGGLDSMALLDYLAHSLGHRLVLVVAHLNHSLRGSESDGDEMFVRDVAARYGLRIVCDRVDVTAVARKRGISLEEAGREARYAFLAEVAARVAASSIALAHHADDQAETVLIRLLRGSGTTGLRGMNPVSSDARHIRPFLRVTRHQIEEYAAERCLDFRTDNSNTDRSFLRNRIRHELLPLLKEYNPSVVERLNDTATILGHDADLLSTIVDRRWQEVGRRKSGKVLLDLTAVCKDSVGMRLRLYRHALVHLSGSLRRISFSHLEAIDRLVFGRMPNGRLHLPSGIRVIRSYGILCFSLVGCEVAEESYEVVIDAKGRFPIPASGSIVVSDLREAASYSEGPNIRVDTGRFPFPWTVRPFRPGDRMVPLGMTGHKKVKDIFIDAKLPQPVRRRLPLFFSGAELFWIPGIRQAATCEHDSPDERVMWVCLLEIEYDPAILP